MGTPTAEFAFYLQYLSSFTFNSCQRSHKNVAHDNFLSIHFGKSEFRESMPIMFSMADVPLRVCIKARLLD